MGKLIGAVLGFLVGGPLFALLGLAAGHFFDRGLGQAMGFDYAGARAELQTQFFETCFRVMGHIAKADGRVCEDEVAQAEAIIAKLGLQNERRQQAINLFKEGSAADFTLEPEMSRFLQRCGRQVLMRQMLLEALLSISLADGKLDPAETDILGKVAHYLGVPERDFQRLLQMATAQQHFHGQGSGGQRAPCRNALQEAYQALGVSESISAPELKKAYRKLMSQHHPDKLIAKGVPEDMIKIATEKAQEIQAAYDLIQKHRKAK
ncbi:co-chaperone DjlA [Spongiibacter sp. KMU-158]|uniref:Co-chaperone protein DjlA n=1 Tax=Spongiibacter pelagi TaxID=2760804 RepID=A0A927C0F0_9GAMM|nr:co-chaperone DjlA [Spongiibacter pelagi]MBD2857592.1 co-chaperone DjlA [Spongiibacter pelagi]